MAKPKLSSRERVALRRMISEKKKAGAPRAEILKAVSKKYGISPESVRWYLKGTAKASSNGRSGKPAPKTRAAAKRGVAVRIMDVVQQVSAKVLRKALEAKELLPKLEAKLRHRELLAVAHSKARQALRAADSQAKKLRRKFARLISG